MGSGAFALGYWFDRANCYGLEASYFFLPNGSTHKSVSTTGLAGSPNLGVPFIDVFDGSEASYALSSAGRYSGLGSYQVKNEMQGAELNGLISLLNPCSYKMDLLLGFRYWNFEKALHFSQTAHL